MSKPIEGVSERILASAKEEFLEKGYSDASLRTIAAEADTTTGSIYSRYKDKEGLFGAIVDPVAEHLIELFLETQEHFHALEASRQNEMMEECLSVGMLRMVDDIYDHFEEFQILLDASHGTRYTDFVERLVEIETEYTYKYMDVIHFPDRNGEMITEEFIHIMSTALFESMFEVVRHKMTKEHALKYMAMLSRHHNAGWGAILNDRHRTNRTVQLKKIRNHASMVW